LQCECGKPDCPKPGKHPRIVGWQKKATDDPAQVALWLQKWPNTNFGVATGELAMALDVDVRPEKNGQYQLEQIEIEHGQRTSHTVTVMTGRENFSRHLYFRVPNVAMKNHTSLLPGLDVRTKGGYCVAPGSRHINGGWYRFDEECRPDEVGLAEMPDFLLALFPATTPSDLPIPGPQKPYNESLDLGWTEGPDEPLPDYVVVGILRRDRVARFYWDGNRRNTTPSEDDFALACKLAFYCRHNLPQMYRLFVRSGLNRPKFFERRPEGNYALKTLKHAIEATSERWVRKKRVRPSRATGAKKGRKLDPITTAALEVYDADPRQPSTAIAEQLSIPVRKVRDAIRYHRSSSVVENAGPLIHVGDKGIIESVLVVQDDLESSSLEDSLNHAETELIETTMVPVGSHAVWLQKPEPNTFGVFGGFQDFG
jgi:hypothetical protein